MLVLLLIINYDNGYLCNGKTGITEKQFQWHSSNNSQRKSLPITEDNINPLENGINRSKSAKHYRLQTSSKNKSVQSSDRQPFFLTSQSECSFFFRFGYFK
jgi:hypothetical protein